MELVDSHCHLNFPPLWDNLEPVLDNADQHGVAHLLCVSVNIEDFPQIDQLRQRYPQIFASLGVHPNETSGRDPSVAELVELAERSEVIAIGETGLDYYRSSGDLEWQRARFSRHIEAACLLRKPIIVHMRAAPDDTIAIMKESGAEAVGGVMHCFTEDWQVAKKALDLGFYISISGIVTFKNATTVQEVATKLPIDRILVETDAPYLAPVPYRGKPNEPAYVRHTAEFIADLRKQSPEEFAAATTDNFFRAFSQATRVRRDIKTRFQSK